MPAIPAPAHVLQALAPLWPPLYTALEGATQQTRAYFDAEGAPLDRHLAPSLVRYQAKRQLARLGHAAQEDDEAYAFQTLPNNGLSLSYRGDLLYVLRILKALEGQLPAPGASRARQAFWQQQLIFDYAAPSAAELRPSLNLLVLWETDAAYTLRRLSLVCPKVGALTRESVAVYWTIEIPHPNVARALATPAGHALEVPTEVRDDLAIRLRQTAARGLEAPVGSIPPACSRRARCTAGRRPPWRSRWGSTNPLSRSSRRGGSSRAPRSWTPSAGPPGSRRRSSRGPAGPPSRWAPCAFAPAPP
jgi:hypothetical protein